MLSGLMDWHREHSLRPITPRISRPSPSHLFCTQQDALVTSAATSRPSAQPSTTLLPILYPVDSADLPFSPTPGRPDNLPARNHSAATGEISSN